jgi:protein-histidine pros-kinase
MDAMTGEAGLGVGPDGPFATPEEGLRFLRSVLESSTSYSIIATDLADTILFWNEGAHRLYGYAPDEVIGRQHASLHASAGVLSSLPEAMMRDTLEAGKWEGTVERMRKDGSEFMARVVMTLRRNGDGQPDGFLLISRDVTEELRLIAELERSQYTRSVFEAAPDAIVIVNEAGQIQLANAATETLFGYPREELLGRSIDLLIPARHRGVQPDLWASLFDEPSARPMGEALQLSGRRSDGFEFPVEISLSPLETDQGLFATAAMRDVTDRVRFENGLREANAKLERASHAKNRFLANMSHELRTPLNAILGFTGTLLMEIPGALNDEQTRQLRTVQASGRHLLSLINDLLDLARIEAGKLELTIESIDCRELIEEVAEGLRPLAGDKGLELAIDAPAEPIELATDRRALSQILINLTNNAIKFTDHGSVRVELAPGAADTSGARFTIVDTGCGIHEDDQKSLFAAFEQVDSSGNHPYGGTGLGLYICQTLAALIGGAITFESKYGEGSSFTLEVTPES